MDAVKWSDVGHTRMPGSFSVDGVTIEVEQKHIDAWLADPDGVWRVATSPGSLMPATTTLREFHEAQPGR